MSLKCEIHTEIEAKAVCHHCGKPVCNLTPLPYTGLKGQLTKSQLCGYIVIDDDFDDRLVESVRTVHCENCLVEHHNNYAAALQRLKSSL